MWKLKPVTHRYIQWIVPNLMHQTRRKNVLEQKGLKDLLRVKVIPLPNYFMTLFCHYAKKN